jgi:septum formation protein
MDNPKINKYFILGSGSKRRSDLLKQIGVNLDLVLPPEINEIIKPKELPINYVKRMAIEKNIIFQDQHKQSIILTADTIVSLGRRVLPKAINKEIAESCLKQLSGRRHKVYTSFAISSPNNILRTKTVQSIVKFKRLDAKEILYYLDSNEWEGKAGGYAIQGVAASFINFISGSYSNIVGLPLAEVYRMLLSVGYEFRNDK